ncbi:hypothetical protein Lal_00003025 [Lupinus albus]|nr:hypothetical protein Lal_00003025 [Lupinus albus]
MKEEEWQRRTTSSGGITQYDGGLVNDRIGEIDVNYPLYAFLMCGTLLLDCNLWFSLWIVVCIDIWLSLCYVVSVYEVYGMLSGMIWVVCEGLVLSFGILLLDTSQLVDFAHKLRKLRLI